MQHKNNNNDKREKAPEWRSEIVFRMMTRKYLSFQIEKDNGLLVSINEKW